MDCTRRDLIRIFGAAGAAGLVGCRSIAPTVERTPRRVVAIHRGVPTTDGAGVRLTRVIGHGGLRNLDPFLMLDRFHSDDPNAYIRGFPDHPHRGFETVTVMLEGRMRHRDSRGNSGLIQSGGSQWMTAGRGIVHSEMPEQVQGLMSGFQLWVNLPAREKMRGQEYQDLAPERLAEGRISPAGSRLRVISGAVDGLVGPVPPRSTEPLLFNAFLEDDRPLEFDVAPGHTAFAFVAEGELATGPVHDERRVSESQLAVFGEGSRVRMRAPERRTLVLVAAAKPLREPVVQSGPFVMNTEEEIRRAYDDYRRGVLDRG
jgi:redox-sensitive bicupin YhaK (pirin superfamily)